MARFSFRYERLLRLAFQKERQQAFAVGKKMAEVISQRRKVDELREQWEKLRNEWLRDENATSQQAIDLAVRAKWANEVRRRLEIEVLRLEQEQKKLDEERTKLAELVKQRKIYEKLKERDRQRYEEQQRKLEQTFLDEIASIADWRLKSGRTITE